MPATHPRTKGGHYTPVPCPRLHNDLVQHVQALAAYSEATPRLLTHRVTATRHRSCLLPYMFEFEIGDKPWTPLSPHRTPDAPIPDPGPRQEFQTPEPGLIPSPNTSPPASRQVHPAPAPLDGPATPVSQTVPYAAHEAWGRATATHIRAITSAVQREEPNAVREATDRLLALPRRVLDARGRGAARRTVARLDRVHRGESLDDEQMQGEHPDERPGEGFRKGPLHHQQRRRIHRQLQLGNISCAARVLQESPLATVTDEVLEVLTALHPHEDPPQPPAAEECPVQITPGILAKVLDKVPRGSAAGPSGWTYEHVKATVKAGVVRHFSKSPLPTDINWFFINNTWISTARKDDPVRLWLVTMGILSSKAPPWDILVVHGHA
jgi:hypothetical protein